MRRRVLIAVCVLALTGCAGHGAEHRSAPEPAEPTAPPPPSSTWVSPYDAEVMLERDAPLEDLRQDLIRNLQLLDTVRVEIHEPTPDHDEGVVTLDVDYAGNCSGTVVTPKGVAYRVVKRGNRMVTTTDEGAVGAALDGRWVVVQDPLPFTEKCDTGAASFIDQRTADNRGTWLLTSGEKLGMEKIRGESALHVRQNFGSTDWDIWVAAFADERDPSKHRLYPVKISSRSASGVQVRYFSGFNRTTIAKMPPVSQIVDPGASQA